MTLSISKKSGVVAVALCLTGCATGPGQEIGQAFNNTFNNPDPCSNNKRNLGIAAGGIAGAIIGKQIGDGKAGNALAGALIGASVGGLIGADFDKRRCALAKVAKEYNLAMAFAAVDQDGLTVPEAQIQQLEQAGKADAVKERAIGNIVAIQDSGESGGHFEKNSDVLTKRAQQYFSALASIYHENAADTARTAQGKPAAATSDRKFLLLGHTDDTGSSQLNAELSERRARAVAQYLESRGIGRDQLLYQGAGEVYPVADNNSEAGRAQNRRVEIVELSDTKALATFLNARRPNYRFYRATPVKRSEAVASGPATNGKPSAAQSTSRTTRRDPVLATSGEPKLAKGREIATASAPRTVKRGQQAVASTPGSRAAASPASNTASATAPARRSVGKVLDFGGTPFNESALAASRIGKLEKDRPLFAFISSAQADELPALSDCTRDRPRISGAVRALRDGKTYKVIEHVPGLYGKTWTDQVNGHKVVINKVAVLANEASLAQIPEFKVYANYNPALNRNPTPDITLSPQVNTYLGEQGILYRIFAEGASGIQCVDIVYPRQGGGVARSGNIVYARENRLFLTDFKPVIAN